MEFSIYLDAGLRRKVTRYFHSGGWGALRSRPCEWWEKKIRVCETEPS